MASSSSSSRHPSLKWAQRSDKLFITIELPDATDVKVQLEPQGKFTFSASKDGVPYELDVELLDKINVEESKYNVGLRSIVYSIKKAEDKWWGRLLKPEWKPPAFLKVDWDKWVDEDEESGVPEVDDMDFSKFGMGGGPGDFGMGGGPGDFGMGGLDEFGADELEDEEEEEPAEQEEKGKVGAEAKEDENKA
ncbi:Co-chaperone protein p23-1-like protein [Drosera capensis]